MGRPKGLVPFPGNIEPEYSGFFDARMQVDYIEDLINPDTWKALDGNVYVFNNMPVLVKNGGFKKDWYVLIDADNYTDINSWHKLTKEEIDSSLLNSKIEISKTYLLPQLTFMSNINNLLLHSMYIDAPYVYTMITSSQSDTNQEMYFLKINFITRKIVQHSNNVYRSDVMAYSYYDYPDFMPAKAISKLQNGNLIYADGSGLFRVFDPITCKLVDEIDFWADVRNQAGDSLAANFYYDYIKDKIISTEIFYASEFRVYDVTSGTYESYTYTDSNSGNIGPDFYVEEGSNRYLVSTSVEYIYKIENDGSLTKIRRIDHDAGTVLLNNKLYNGHLIFDFKTLTSAYTDYGIGYKIETQDTVLHMNPSENKIREYDDLGNLVSVANTIIFENNILDNKHSTMVNNNFLVSNYNYDKLTILRLEDIRNLPTLWLHTGHPANTDWPAFRRPKDNYYATDIDGYVSGKYGDIYTTKDHKSFGTLSINNIKVARLVDYLFTTKEYVLQFYTLIDGTSVIYKRYLTSHIDEVLHTFQGVLKKGLTFYRERQRLVGTFDNNSTPYLFTINRNEQIVENAIDTSFTTNTVLVRGINDTYAIHGYYQSLNDPSNNVYPTRVYTSEGVLKYSDDLNNSDRSIETLNVCGDTESNGRFSLVPVDEYGTPKLYLVDELQYTFNNSFYSSAQEIFAYNPNYKLYSGITNFFILLDDGKTITELNPITKEMTSYTMLYPVLDIFPELFFSTTKTIFVLLDSGSPRFTYRFSLQERS